MARKKLIQYGIQIAVGLGIAVAVMGSQGAFSAEKGMQDRVLAVCNGFSVTALLYLAFGILLFASSAGVLDILSYAIHKGAHFLVPMIGREDVGGYYEYKIKKAEKRKGKTLASSLIVGCVFLAVGILLTAVWYGMAG